MPNGRFLIGLGLIFFLGIALRFYQLGAVPVSLYWDEVAMLVDARSVAATGQDMYGNSWLQAIYPSYGDYKLPFYIWLASLSVKIFGATEWALRMPSAAAGVLTMLMGGLIVWELFPQAKRASTRWLFLITAGVIAITPWSIIFSRIGFEGHVGQLLLASSIWLALKAKKHWGWGVLSALMGGLATYTYFSIRFVWPVVFVAAIWLFATKKSWVWLVLSLILPLVIYAASLQPMYRSPWYSASNQFRLSTTSVFNMTDWPVVANEYKLQAGNTVFDKLVYHPWVLMGRELANNYADNLSAEFLFLSGDPNLRHGTGRHGLFLRIFLLPFLYGWYALFHKHWRQSLLLLVWWLIALLPASVPETTPHALRSLNALVPLAVVIAWGTWQGWQALLNIRWPRLLKVGLLGSLLAVTLLSVFDFASFYFKAYPALSAKEWQDGYKAVAHEAWLNKEAMDVVWVEPFDSRFYLWLLAYEVPVEEYSQLEFVNFMPNAIGNIRFRWFDWKKLPTLSEKTMLLAKKDFIDWNLETVPYPPRWYKTFSRTDGVPEFAAIYFEKSE